MSGVDGFCGCGPHLKHIDYLSDVVTRDLAHKLDSFIIDSQLLSPSNYTNFFCDIVRTWSIEFENVRVVAQSLQFSVTSVVSYAYNWYESFLDNFY
jgi:hypothetical protein